jgi:hypothetical protein
MHGWAVTVWPMRRRIFTLVSMLSMLLFAVTTGIWIWSYKAPSPWPYDAGIRVTNSGQGTSQWVWRTRFLSRGGFGCVEHTRYLGQYEITGSDNTIWWVPLWPLIIASGVLPAIWLAPMARAAARTALTRVSHSVRRSRAGRCVACGYDLRATPGRCPECGTAAGGRT